MKYGELKNLKAEDIEKRYQEAQLELMKLAGQASTGTAPKKPTQIKNLRRTIARIQTHRATQKQ